MNDWIQLVLVVHEDGGTPYLFQAPWSTVKPGEMVVVETKYGPRKGRAIMTVNEPLSNEQRINAIVDACNAKWPLSRVLKYFVCCDVEYKEETNDTL